jgi:hypothetical protein
VDTLADDDDGMSTKLRVNGEGRAVEVVVDLLRVVRPRWFGWSTLSASCLLLSDTPLEPRK